MQLQSMRPRAGMSQRSIATSLNIDRSTVTKWETGKAKPRASMLIKLAALLGCTVDELLRDDK